MCGAIDFSGAKLVEINMSDNAFGPIGLEALTEFFQAGCCHSLRELRLHNNGLGPQGAQKLAHSLEQGWRKSGQRMALKVAMLFVSGSIVLFRFSKFFFWVALSSWRVILDTL